MYLHHNAEISASIGEMLQHMINVVFEYELSNSFVVDDLILERTSAAI